MDKFKLFQQVIVLNDKYLEDGIKKGAIGNIVEIWDEKNVEIDFCNKHNNFSNIVIAVSVDDIAIKD